MAKIKKLIIIILNIFIITTLLADTTMKKAHISVNLIKPIKLTVSNEIDFGTHIIGGSKPRAQTTHLTIANVAINRKIQVTIVPSSNITNLNGDKINLDVKIQNPSLTKSGIKDPTTLITVSLIELPTKVGDYNGDITVNVDYN